MVHAGGLGEAGVRDDDDRRRRRVPRARARREVREGPVGPRGLPAGAPSKGEPELLRDPVSVHRRQTGVRRVRRRQRGGPRLPGPHGLDEPDARVLQPARARVLADPRGRIPGDGPRRQQRRRRQEGRLADAVGPVVCRGLGREERPGTLAHVARVLAHLPRNADRGRRGRSKGRGHRGGRRGPRLRPRHRKAPLDRPSAGRGQGAVAGGVGRLRLRLRRVGRTRIDPGLPARRRPRASRTPDASGSRSAAIRRCPP